MGGFGSGRRRQYLHLQELPRIDALACRDALDDLRHGVTTFQNWPVNCVTINGRKKGALVKADRISVQLELTYGTEEWTVDNDVLVKWIPCHFGGFRPLIQCMRCGGNARYLFLRPLRRSFVCRVCTCLIYRTQSVDDDQQSQIAITKIQTKLAPKIAHLLDLDDVPPKPRWMRWRTYQKSITRLNRLELKRDAIFDEKAIRLMGRFLNYPS
jgi:hypothetical protein